MNTLALDRPAAAAPARAAAPGRPLVSAAEYARMARLDKSTVTRQIAAGIIPTHGRGPTGAWLVDPAEADRARAAGVDVTKARGVMQGDALKQAGATAPEPAAPIDRDADGAGDGDADGEADDAASDAGHEAPRQAGNLNYQNARTAREAVQAKLAQLEYEEKIGSLLDRREVEAAFQTLGVMVRDRILAALPLLAAQLAGMTEPAAIIARLNETLQRVLTEAAGEIEDRFKGNGRGA